VVTVLRFIKFLAIITGFGIAAFGICLWAKFKVLEIDSDLLVLSVIKGFIFFDGELFKV